MLEALFERLRLVTLQDDGTDVKEYALKQQERQQLKDDIQAAKAEREAELAQLAEAEAEMDYMDAIADSFAGGPGNEGETQ